MTYYLYQWEAVFIQDYVLAGGKIKTMVGASEIIEAITNELLDVAVAKLGVTERKIKDISQKGELDLEVNEVVFPRRAGGVFMMIACNDKTAEDFAQLWPILVSNFAPGLRFSAVLESDENLPEAAKKVRHALNDQKNQPQTFLPESTPLTVRFQKTGLAQVDAPAGTKKDGSDWTMQAKLNHKFKSLADKHIDKKNLFYQGKSFVFPQLFEHKHTDSVWQESFPFKTIEPGNHSIAIIHTDGNGLGLYVQKIFAELSRHSAAEYVHGYAEFSQGLDEATQEAAQKATRWLIQHYQQEDNPYKDEIRNENVLPLPMRPLILGGDDLTCIVRADYALGFINKFTEAFEQRTKDFLGKLDKLKKVFPEKLTCTTGMIFIKSNQPFSLAYALAEELCSTAKKEGQKISAQQSTNKPMPPSLISFLHTTNTLFDELDVQLKQELKTQNGKSLSLCPYAFRPDQGRPTLNKLFELKSHFDKDKEDKLNPSAIRNFGGHLHQDPHYAATFWDRWQKLVGDDKAKTRQAWQDFESLWNQMSEKHPKPNHLPVADLVSLFALDIKDPNSTPKTEATV